MLIFLTLIGRNLSNRKALWKYSKGLFHYLELSRVAGALLLEAGCVDDALDSTCEDEVLRSSALDSLEEVGVSLAGCSVELSTGATDC